MDRIIGTRGGRARAAAAARGGGGGGAASIAAASRPLRSPPTSSMQAVSLRAGLLLLPAGFAEVIAASACADDAGCNYNGVCTESGSCHCAAAFQGATCSQLSLEPTPSHLGYHGTNAAGRVTSWGGSVVAGDDGLFHMYAAEITGNCGMNVWLSNSQVIHATSPDPTTQPFTRVGVVAGVFAHEPIAARAPTGEYVVWYTAVLPPLLPPVKGGQRCQNCSNGVSAASCGTDSNRNATTPLPTYMVYSQNPNGPWSRPALVPGTAVFADSNFAPVIAKNGSLVALSRHAVIHGASWRDVSTYKQVSTWHDAGEDPYVFIDRNGIYHNIVHDGRGPRSHSKGLLYWSRDAISWTAAADEDAFSDWLTFSNGTKQELECRERPHVVQDRRGDVIALTNGASPVTCHRAGGDDFSFTSLQLVRSP
jgi:hypothetical protein